MKVLSILALCAVLLFAITCAHQTEDNEQVIEQDNGEQMFEQEQTFEQNNNGQISKRDNMERALLQAISRLFQERESKGKARGAKIEAVYSGGQHGLHPITHIPCHCVTEPCPCNKGREIKWKKSEN